MNKELTIGSGIKHGEYGRGIICRTELIIQYFAPGAVISWGKNSENTKRLIKHIEGSFTI